MGLIRKSLFLGTGGIVAPNSKKQRTALQTLAAVQGKSEAEVRRTGGRYEHTIGTEFTRSKRPADKDSAEAKRRAYPLWREEHELLTAGASKNEAILYATGAVIPPTKYGRRQEGWRRYYLTSRPEIAAKLFPDGLPPEP
jgi:hypothetical protein